MNFTKAVYRKARSRAMNDLISAADILEWSKETLRRLGQATPENYWTHVEYSFRVEEARAAYFEALDKAMKIVARGRREGKMK